MNNDGGMGIYSFLQPVADIIEKVITALYQLTVAIGFPSYALAIVMISILIKIILYPFYKILKRFNVKYKIYKRIYIFYIESSYS